MESIAESAELQKFSPISDRRPFEVILRGGKPWGFGLSGGDGEDTPLHVSEIEPGSNAEDSALLVGDRVLGVNGIPCGQADTAWQLIHSAFRTLTLTVLRGWDVSRGVRSQSACLSHRASSSSSLPAAAAGSTLSAPETSSSNSNSNSTSSSTVDGSPLQPEHNARPTARPRSGSLRPRRPLAAHDDSALYAHSKASMKPSRPRRGDSFSVRKSSHAQLTPTSSDPPWERGHQQQLTAAHAKPRSHQPEVSKPAAASAKDRRYSDAPGRFALREADSQGDLYSRSEVGCRERHMVSAKSSPNLVRTDQGGSGFATAAAAAACTPPSADCPPVKAVKSSPDIPEDVAREGHRYCNRPSFFEPSLSSVSTRPFTSYGAARYSFQEEPSSKVGGHSEFHRRLEKAKRHSEDMYTSDMNVYPDTEQVLHVPKLSLHKYQADYENVTCLATAPLGSERISELEDLEDGMCEGDQAPSIPPRPACGKDSEFCSPTPPIRDAASLKYIKVNQNHEKYPSWPVTQQPSPAGSSSTPEPQAPINTRAQSWTDHTSTHTEFPHKQRLAYQPGLRPLAEKNSPTPGTTTAAEGRGAEDAASKAPRNSSDPGLKTPEFTYGRYGQVIQKREEKSQGGFEEFYHNSKPGYLPPRVDSDGHSYGDKEYSAPSPPERDFAGVDRLVLTQALGAEASEERTQPARMPQQPQPQEPVRQPTGGQHGSSNNNGLPRHHQHHPHPLQHQLHNQRPSMLTTQSTPLSSSPLSSSSAAQDSRRVADSATSPLSPHDVSVPGLREGGGTAGCGNLREPFRRDSASASMQGVRGGQKQYVVKPTPYYNTSTQTDMQVYALKTADLRLQRNVEIQVSGQAGPSFEEKAIQARMSREFHAADLGPGSPKKYLTPVERRSFFNFSEFEGIQSIKAKYGTDEMCGDANDGDGASIMRKLSEEFYGGSKLGVGDKRLSSSSSQEPSPKPDLTSSRVSVHSGTMSQAESYASVVIHPSESAGPFGRDDYGSQSSISDSHQDLTRAGSRGRNSLDYFTRPAPRPLAEAKKFNSLTAIVSHPREGNLSALSRYGAKSQESLSVDTRWRRGSHREPGSASEASSFSPLSQPHSLEYRGPGSRMESSSHDSPIRSGKFDSFDCVLNDSRASDRSVNPAGRATGAESVGVSGGQSGSSGGSNTGTELGRKPSMKKAYGIYDEGEKLLSTGTKDSRTSGPSSQDGNSRSRGSNADGKPLDQIQEEASDSSPAVLLFRTSNLVRHTTQEDVSDHRLQTDSWQNGLEGRLNRSHRPMSEHCTSSSRDRNTRNYEQGHRPPRQFDGSIDSGVGSDIGSMRASDSQLSSMDSLSSQDWRKMQTRQVLKDFVDRKTSKPSATYSSSSSVSAELSRDSSMHESFGTNPRSPHSPTSESVSELITKTNENLAKREDSIRRSGSMSSRSSSLEYMEMKSHERPYKETDWRRLRNSETFQYGSDRGSVSSLENTTYDDSVFPSSPRGGGGSFHDSSQQMGDFTEEHANESKMESGVISSPNYQNFPGDGSQRRPPPPPPRESSPETRPPPALPPRNYLPRDDNDELQDFAKEATRLADDGEEARRDFRGLREQWERQSPREDAYAAQLRREAAKMTAASSSSNSGGGSAGRGGGVGAGMSVVSTRPPMAVSTSYKRQPTVPQEATTPAVSSSSTALTFSQALATVSGVNSVIITPAANSLATSHAHVSAVCHQDGPHRRTGSYDVGSPLNGGGGSSSGGGSLNSSMSPSSSSNPMPSRDSPLGLFVDRNTKPSAYPAARPPPGPTPTPLQQQQQVERPAIPPREDAQHSLFVRAEYGSRDRSGSDVPHQAGRDTLCVPEVASRDRSLSDTKVFGRTVSDGSLAFANGSGGRGSIDGAGSGGGFFSSQGHRDAITGSPGARRRESQVQLSTSAASATPGLLDAGQLPPPPPELLNHGSSPDQREIQSDLQFAEDSYITHKIKHNRQVGTYTRSSSAAIIRQEDHHNKHVAEASAVFSDRKLGSQNWNSDSQLQSGRGRDFVSGEGAANGLAGPGSVPAFKADSNLVRAVKVPIAQPLSASYQASASASTRSAQGAESRDGKMLTAKPYQAEAPRGGEDGLWNGGDLGSPKQSRSVKDRVSNLERKNSFTSPFISTTSPTSTTTAVETSGGSPSHTAGTPTSTSQKWANAAPFEATHGVGVERPIWNSSNNNVSPARNSRSVVLTDSPSHLRPAGERAGLGSPPLDSTHNCMSSRPRALSERTRFGDGPAPASTLPPASEYAPQPQGYPSMTPAASDPRSLPGHIRNATQGSSNNNDHSRAVLSPFYRRESEPVFCMQPADAALTSATAMAPPRRKSEGVCLSTQAGWDPEDGVQLNASHSRQPSQEELECDQRARELAREVAESEKKLSDVLSTDSTQKRMKYMGGLSFGETGELPTTPASIRKLHSPQAVGDPSSFSPSSLSSSSSPGNESPALEKRNSLPKAYFVSSSKAVIEMELRRQEEMDTEFTRNIQDSETLIKQKEELIEKLHKKLHLLKEERQGLQEEISHNNSLGQRVSTTVDSKCQNSSERDKFHTYIEDLEKIVRLLLNLSGQLARAENAVQCLPENSDSRTKKMTQDKLERLQTKHAEAKQLKEDIDRRSTTVSSFLRQSLSPEELNDYAYFVRMKSKLTIDLQELEDKITLGQEQIQELRKSIPERPLPKPESAANSVSSASPRASPCASPAPSASS